MKDWLSERVNRPLPDTAREPSRVLIDRSQRVALSKGRFRANGWAVPTRIAVFDGYLLCDSVEPGGGISLRWETLAQVLAGVGLIAWRDGRWRPVEELTSSQ